MNEPLAGLPILSTHTLWWHSMAGRETDSFYTQFSYITFSPLGERCAKIALLPPLRQPAGILHNCAKNCAFLTTLASARIEEWESRGFPEGILSVSLVSSEGILSISVVFP